MNENDEILFETGFFDKVLKKDVSYADFSEFMIDGLLSGKMSKEKAIKLWTTLIKEIYDPLEERILAKTLSFYISQNEGIIIKIDKNRFLVYGTKRGIKCYPLGEQISGDDLTDGLLVKDIEEYDNEIISFSKISIS